MTHAIQLFWFLLWLDFLRLLLSSWWESNAVSFGQWVAPKGKLQRFVQKKWPLPESIWLLGLWMCMKISIWNMVSTVAPQRQSIWCDHLLNPIGRPSTSEKKGTARKPNDTDWIQIYLIKVNSWPFVKTCWKLYRDPLCHGFHISTETGPWTKPHSLKMGAATKINACEMTTWNDHDLRTAILNDTAAKTKRCLIWYQLPKKAHLLNFSLCLSSSVCC